MWVFGDSYTTPDVCVSPEQSFWGLTAKELGVSTICNLSRSGNSFDSICQLLVGEQSDYNWKTDFFFITIPPLERITVFDDFKDTLYKKYLFNLPTWNKDSASVLSHHGLISISSHHLDKFLIMHLDRAWLEVQVLRELFLISQWLDSKKANYIIVNVSKDLDIDNHWGPSEFVLRYCKEHPKFLLFEKSLYNINLNINKPGDFDQYGWFGHHDSTGCEYFFEHSILPLLKKNQFC
jgi:hypothetical protein